MNQVAKSISQRAVQQIKAPGLQPLVPASFPLGNAWFVICCFAKQEADARTDIEALGYETWTPEERKLVVLRGRRTEVVKPLFPGYFFTSFDRERDAWAVINDIDGVFCVMTNDGLPMRIPDADIDRLRRAQEAGLFDRTNPAANFKLDELVEIMKDGPLFGVLAQIKTATAKKRVKLFNKYLGTITIDPVYLKKLAG